MSQTVHLALRSLLAAVLAAALLAESGPLQAQDALEKLTAPAGQQSPKPAAEETKDEEQAPGKVEVRPVARDQEIAARLERILDATGWYVNPAVRVEEGVVFLGGRTKTEPLKKWAGDLARNTRDVVAVVNRIELMEPSIWDVRPALEEMGELWRRFLRSVPMIAFALVVLAVAWLAGMATMRLARRTVLGRIQTPLLREVLARAAGVVIFLLGLYLVLLVMGLARLAVTVLGGTGLIGLVIGIAFRDITENFLASIFLSMQHPFRTGDLVEIEKVTGFVQRLTIRSTVLMTLDGNHVQIPNATVYKTTIRNFTSNPNRREDFTVGIGAKDLITEAQEIALGVLASHPAVLKEPEPWVLVDDLAPSAVNLKIYFWLDGTKHSWLKVRSSVIRLVKRAFQEHGISMPDPAREVLFPEEVPVRLLGGGGGAGELERGAEGAARALSPPVPVPLESDSVSTAAEAGLRSEAAEVQEQGRRSRSPEEGENLLE